MQEDGNLHFCIFYSMFHHSYTQRMQTGLDLLWAEPAVENVVCGQVNKRPIQEERGLCQIDRGNHYTMHIGYIFLPA